MYLFTLKGKMSSYLLPPTKMFSTPFFKQVLNGKKQFLKMTDGGPIPHVDRRYLVTVE